MIDDPRAIVFAVSLALFVIVARRMGVLANGLHPRIIDLELASTRDNVNLLLRSWESGECARAARIVGLDYLMLLAYGAGGAALASLLADFAAEKGWWLARTGDMAAIAFVAGALFDAVENLLMLLMMACREVGRVLPAATAVFAFSKFAVTTAGLLFFVAIFIRAEAAGVIWMARKLWPG